MPMQMIMTFVFFVPCFAFGVTFLLAFKMVLVFGAAIVAEFFTFTTSMVVVPAWDGSQACCIAFGCRMQTLIAWMFIAMFVCSK